MTNIKLYWFYEDKIKRDEDKWRQKILNELGQGEYWQYIVLMIIKLNANK